MQETGAARKKGGIWFSKICPGVTSLISKHHAAPLLADKPLLPIQGTLVPKLTIGPFLTLSVRNGSSVSFGTNFPCNHNEAYFRPYTDLANWEWDVGNELISLNCKIKLP